MLDKIISKQKPFSQKANNDVNKCHCLLQHYPSSLLIVRNKSPYNGKLPCLFLRLNKSAWVACTYLCHCSFAQEAVRTENKFNFFSHQKNEASYFSKRIGGTTSLNALKEKSRCCLSSFQGTQKQRRRIFSCPQAASQFQSHSCQSFFFVVFFLNQTLFLFFLKMLLDKLP